MKHIKTISLLLCLLLVLPSVGFCSATYQITEQEIQTLSNNSQRLKQINDYLQLNSSDSQKTLLQVSKELMQSKAELITLKQELATLQATLLTAKNLSQSQQDLLQKTNESFQQYSKEQKVIQSKLKRNNFILQILTGIAITYAAIK